MRDEHGPETEPRGALVPSRRHPPAVIGTGTPPPPEDRLSRVYAQARPLLKLAARAAVKIGIAGLEELAEVARGVRKLASK